jgi:nucleoside phosphorylase
MGTGLHLVVVTAFGEEAKIAKRALEHCPRVFTSCEVQTSGMGIERSRRWAESFLSGHPQSVILITGFCGGLSIPVHVGDVIIPHTVQVCVNGNTSCSYRQNNTFVANMERRLLAEASRYKTVTMITSNDIVEDERSRAELFRNTNAEVVDMESASIAAVCEERGNACFVVKVVSDDRTADLTGLNELYHKSEGLTRGTMAKWLFEHPVMAISMRKNMGLAKQNLASALLNTFLELDVLYSQLVST